MKRVIASMMAVTLVAVLAGCSGGGNDGPMETIAVTANHLAYDTREITLEKGKTYKLVFTNNDTVEHDLSIDQMPVKKAAGGHSEHAAGNSAALHVHAPAGKTESIAFTPTEGGIYSFYCTVAGHKDAGMVGQVTVK